MQWPKQEGLPGEKKMICPDFWKIKILHMNSLSYGTA
jgi:hypothetical protein